VAWHFLLYMVAQFVEFSPAAAEWMGLRRTHRILTALTVGAVIFGTTLSMLHQSGLGALFLMAKYKIHPLWYSEFIPILFLVSSIFAGLSMVIFEGSISRKVFAHRMTPDHDSHRREIVLSLSRICAGAMFVYLFLQIIVLVHGQHIGLLGTGMGLWYLLEVIGFVVVPCALFTYASRTGNLAMIRTAAILTLVGIILNRLNISVIAYNWDAAVRYVPTWMEIEVSLAVITTQICVFRWVVNRMPVVSESPVWARAKKDSPKYTYRKVG